MILSREEALRLTEVYTPSSLPDRLQAFVPSRDAAEARARAERCRAEVKRITLLQAANEDVEQA